MGRLGERDLGIEEGDFNHEWARIFTNGEETTDLSLYLFVRLGKVCWSLGGRKGKIRKAKKDPPLYAS